MSSLKAGADQKDSSDESWGDWSEQEKWSTTEWSTEWQHPKHDDGKWETRKWYKQKASDNYESGDGKPWSTWNNNGRG